MQTIFLHDQNASPEYLHSLGCDIDSIEHVIHLVFKSDTRELRRNVRIRLVQGYSTPPKGSIIHRNQECKQIFKRAVELAANEKITCTHLLNAILENPGEIIGAFLKKQEEIPGYKQTDREKVSPNRALTPMLDQYGRDLTGAARAGKLGPLVGRRNEILQVIQILARQKKNNPVLVGEAGVGKTAIIEALAQRIVQGKDAEALAGKRIVELTMGALVAGAQYRGEFEERLTKIVAEVQENPEIILFIDELHTIIGAGQIGQGGLDAGNILQPALARGNFRLIGSTTIAEYRKYIETDPALERRFEIVIVNRIFQR